MNRSLPWLAGLIIIGGLTLAAGAAEPETLGYGSAGDAQMLKAAGAGLATLANLARKLDHADLAGRINLPDWSAPDDAAALQALAALKAADLYFQSRGALDFVSLVEHAAASLDAEMRAGLVIPLYRGLRPVEGRAPFPELRTMAARLAEDKEPLVRAGAVYVLGVSGLSRTEAWKALQDSAAEVRLAACLAAWREFKLPAAALDILWQDPSIAVRVAAAVAKCAPPGKDVSALLPLLQDSNPLARAAALACGGALASKSASPRPSLMALLNKWDAQDDLWLRRVADAVAGAEAPRAPNDPSALEGAGEPDLFFTVAACVAAQIEEPIGGSMDFIARSRSGQADFDPPRSSPRPLFRALGVLALPPAKAGAENALKKALQDEDPLVRQAALAAALIFPYAERESVKAAFKSTDYLEAALAAQVLAGAPWDEARKLFENELRERPQAAALRPFLARLLQRQDLVLQTDALAGLCAPLLESHQADLQVLYVRRLALWGYHAPCFARLVQAGEWQASLAAIEAAFGGGDHGPALARLALPRLGELFKSPDQVVRRAAVTACARFLDHGPCPRPGPGVDEALLKMQDELHQAMLTQTLAGGPDDVRAGIALLGAAIKTHLHSGRLPAYLADAALTVLTKAPALESAPAIAKALEVFRQNAPLPAPLDEAVTRNAKGPAPRAPIEEQVMQVIKLAAGSDKMALDRAREMCMNQKVPAELRASLISFVFSNQRYTNGRVAKLAQQAMREAQEPMLVRRTLFQALAEHEPSRVVLAVAAVRFADGAGEFVLGPAELRTLRNMAIRSGPDIPGWRVDLAEVGKRLSEDQAAAPEVREAAIALYAETGDAQAKKDLEALILNDEAPAAIRTAAARELLSRQPESEIYARILPQYDGHLPVRLRHQLALGAARAVDSDKATEIVLLAFDDYWQNFGRASLLNALQLRSTPKLRELINMFGTVGVEDLEMSTAAVAWIGNHPGPTWLFAYYLPQYPNEPPALRLQLALAAAGAPEAPQAEEMVVAGLRDPDLARGCYSIVERLCLKATPSLLEAVTALALTRTAEAPARARAAEWVLEADSQSALFGQLLTDFAEQPRDARLSLAELAAKNTKRTQAAELVLATLNDKDLGANRARILYALKPPGTPELRAVIEELEKDVALRQAAQKALTQLGK